MPLLNFCATNFRNLSDLSLEPVLGVNLFCGPNGSGKTSILEAIHYLGLGRSFRSNVLQRIIKYGADNFVIYGNVSNDSGDIAIGIKKSIAGDNKIKISHNEIGSRAELATLLPIQLITQNSYRIFELGPKFRRQFIDWGLFHVEQSFFPLWKKFTRVLEQRNAALKAKASVDALKSWDQEFIFLAEELNKVRSEYVMKLIPQLKKELEILLGEYAINVQYYSGWDVTNNLLSWLRSGYAKDVQLGYTGYGPQRADLLFYLNNQNAHDVLSRGQLKLLIFALNFAQGKLVQEYTKKKIIYLIDDIGAELDFSRQKLLGKLLSQINAQIFVTGLNERELADIFAVAPQKMFHVEHGEVH